MVYQENKNTGLKLGSLKNEQKPAVATVLKPCSYYTGTSQDVAWAQSAFKLKVYTAPFKEARIIRHTPNSSLIALMSRDTDPLLLLSVANHTFNVVSVCDSVKMGGW